MLMIAYEFNAECICASDWIGCTSWNKSVFAIHCFHFLLSFAKWCLQILDVIYYNLVNTPFTPLGVVPGVKGWLLSYRHFCLYHKTNQYVGVKIFKKKWPSLVSISVLWAKNSATQVGLIATSEPKMKDISFQQYLQADNHCCNHRWPHQKIQLSNFFLCDHFWTIQSW